MTAGRTLIRVQSGYAGAAEQYAGVTGMYRTANDRAVSPRVIMPRAGTLTFRRADSRMMRITDSTPGFIGQARSRSFEDPPACEGKDRSRSDRASRASQNRAVRVRSISYRPSPARKTRPELHQRSLRLPAMRWHYDKTNIAVLGISPTQ